MTEPGLSQVCWCRVRAHNQQGTAMTPSGHASLLPGVLQSRTVRIWALCKTHGHLCAHAGHCWQWPQLESARPVPSHPALLITGPGRRCERLSDPDGKTEAQRGEDPALSQWGRGGATVWFSGALSRVPTLREDPTTELGTGACGTGRRGLGCRGLAPCLPRHLPTVHVLKVGEGQGRWAGWEVRSEKTTSCFSWLSWAQARPD